MARRRLLVLAGMDRDRDSVAGLGAGAGAGAGAGGVWVGDGCGVAAAGLVPFMLLLLLMSAGNVFGAVGMVVFVSVGEVIEEGLLSSGAAPPSCETWVSLVLSAATALSRR